MSRVLRQYCGVPLYAINSHLLISACSLVVSVQSIHGQPSHLLPSLPNMSQGVEYNITFPALRSPTGSISVAIFKDTDCNTQQPLATVESLTVSAATRFETFATFRVPADLPVGSGYILRVQGTVNGAAATIYSEAFAVQQLRTAGGACNANLPYLPPAPRCSPELAWNVSAGPTGMCKFEANGCRTYRWGWEVNSDRPNISSSCVCVDLGVSSIQGAHRPQQPQVCLHSQSKA